MGRQGRHSSIRTVPSSDHVEVYVKGTEVADTAQAMILYETGLRPRYCIPLNDVRRDKEVVDARSAR